MAFGGCGGVAKMIPMDDNGFGYRMQDSHHVETIPMKKYEDPKLELLAGFLITKSKS